MSTVEIFAGWIQGKNGDSEGVRETRKTGGREGEMEEIQRKGEMEGRKKEN